MKYSNDISFLFIERRKPEPLALFSIFGMSFALDEKSLKTRIDNLESEKGDTSEEKKALKALMEVIEDARRR